MRSTGQICLTLVMERVCLHNVEIVMQSPLCIEFRKELVVGKSFWTKEGGKEISALIQGSGAGRTSRKILVPRSRTVCGTLNRL